MSQQSARNAVIIGGNRIPFARSNTAYVNASNQDMFTAALEGLIARFGLQGERIGAVSGGAVLKHSKDFNLIRESVLGSCLDTQLLPTTCRWLARPAWKQSGPGKQDQTWSA